MDSSADFFLYRGPADIDAYRGQDLSTVQGMPSSTNFGRGGSLIFKTSFCSCRGRRILGLESIREGGLGIDEDKKDEENRHQIKETPHKSVFFYRLFREKCLQMSPFLL